MARTSGTDFDIVVWEGGWEIIEKSESHPRENDNLPLFKFGYLNRLFFEILDACNYKCIHCYNYEYRTNRSISSKDFLRALKKLSDRYVFRVIQITGGEPFLHPDLRDIVNIGLGFAEVIEIFTNGSFLQRVETMFSEFKNDIVIRISFYTLNRHLYNRITQSSIAPKDIVREIINLNEKGFQVRVEVPVIPGYNDKHITQIKSLFGKYGVPVKTSLIIPYGNASIFSPESIPFRKNMPAQSDWIFYPPSKSGYNECWATHLAVDPSLNVFPCIFAREWPLGNIKVNNIEVIYRNHMKVAKRYSPDRLKLCKVCAFRYVCKRCPPRAKAYGVLGIAEAGCPLTENR